MSKKSQIQTTCSNCRIAISVKKSKYNRNKNHYCSNPCRYAGMTSDIDKCKEKILELYRVGMTVWEIAKELKLEYPRLCYNFHKWNVEIKKCYHYPQIMNSIGMKRRRKTELDFLGRFKRGEISFRHAHDVASRMWGITEKACGVCGWKEAERDMHLIIPRLLKKKNAVSLCPNCHRLFHRGKLKLSYIKRKLIIVKI